MFLGDHNARVEGFPSVVQTDKEMNCLRIDEDPTAARRQQQDDLDQQSES